MSQIGHNLLAFPWTAPVPFSNIYSKQCGMNELVLQNRSIFEDIHARNHDTRNQLPIHNFQTRKQGYNIYGSDPRISTPISQIGHNLLPFPWTVPVPFNNMYSMQGGINELNLQNRSVFEDIHARNHDTRNQLPIHNYQTRKQEFISGSNPNTANINGLQNKSHQSSNKSKPKPSATLVLTEQDCAFTINNATFYSCPVCSQTFPTFSETQEHVQTHPFRTKEYQCDICHKSFCSTKKLKSHKFVHSENRPYKCDICDSAFKISGQLITHRKGHTGEKRLHCDLCDYRTNEKMHLVYHKNSCHNQELNFICKICGKNCPSPYGLRYHEVTHGEKQFKCKHCGKAFHNKRNCNIHEKAHSPNRIMVQCEICGNKFTGLSGLRKHKLHVHFGAKRNLYQCEFCEKSVTSLSSLKIHRRKHTGDKPFSCDECDKSFASKNSLIAHKRVHTGEKPFTCHLCNKSFSQQGTLIIHHRSHTGIKPYECEKCSKAFVTKTLMKTHMKTHMKTQTKSHMKSHGTSCDD